MDQEVVDNKLTKDLANENSILAIELPSLKILTSLSKEDLEYIENEVIPYSIIKNISNKFENFSEEWHEIVENQIKVKFAKSNSIIYRYFNLKSSTTNYKNKLVSNTYQSQDNFKFKAHELREEVILTDGEVSKGDKKEIKSADELYTEIYQDLEIFNPTYIVVLEREKRVNPFGRWEHHDEIHFYFSDRMTLDYLRTYIGSKF